MSLKILKDSKFKLYGKPFAPGDKSPTLGVTAYRSNLGLSVYTNSERDPDPNNWINAPMSYTIFNQFLDVLSFWCGAPSHINAEEVGNEIAIDNFKSGEDGSSERRLMSTTHAGMAEDGTIWIRIEDADASRPLITFTYAQDFWHLFRDPQSNQPLSPGLASKMACLSWIRSIRDFAPDAIKESVADYTAKMADSGQGQGGGGGNYQKKQWNNGGGGGNYQKKQWNNGGGGGGYQKKQWNNGGGGGGYNRGGGGGYQGGGQSSGEGG